MTGCVTDRESIELALQRTWCKLKDFQRATVERISAQFNDPQHGGRVLVADEVGLGKTIVAKGLIVSMLRDWRKREPMRVTYICSNLSLAAENLTKLAVFPSDSGWVRQPSYERLAHVALCQPEHEDAVLEICTLTPATSFALTKGTGNRRERGIILAALLRHPQLKGSRRSLTALFQDRVQDAKGWEDELRQIERQGLLKPIVDAFLAQIDCAQPDKGQSLLEQLRSVAGLRAQRHRASKREMMRKLRVLFAHCCATQLHADLFILDEFQRFESLLDQAEDSEHSLIAREIFSRERDCKVLLLSATPFKAMSTVADDENDDSHLSKLKQILAFLNLSPLQAYEPARKTLQAELLRLRTDRVNARALDDAPRRAVEGLLRPLICRTERGQIAQDVDGLIDAKPLRPGPELRADDIRAYVSLDRLAVLLENDSSRQLASQLMSFFKSAAWPLSFSTGYNIQQLLQRHYQRSPQEFKRINANKQLWLPRERVHKFTLDVARDAPNPQVRWLTTHLFAQRRTAGPEMLLWLPPSWPHYPLEGFFAGHEQFSKTLLFSSWAMVPRMVSGLVSYEAERRVQQHLTDKTEYFSRRRAGLGQDAQDTHALRRRAVIKLDSGDLASWALIYPARCLIDIPVQRSPATLQQRIAELTRHFKQQLAPFKRRFRGGHNSHHWYLFAPMLLDKVHEGWTSDWFKALSHLVSGGVHQRAAEIARRFEQLDDLGAMPADLPEHLARLALGSPSVCAHRALRQYYPEQHCLHGHVSRVALGFVSLFNGVAGSAIARRLDAEHPWRGIVRYCADGGIQAMLEEYIYLLAPDRSLDGVVSTLENVLRTSPSSVKVWKLDRDQDDTHLRCHYAVPLGAQKSTDDAGQVRIVSIRESFNSPFRPFVLASTSIGQEGLDFHWYCSEVVHWNLPSNPIDLEQREGRVNRYQSLVVRRRVVQAVTGAETPSTSWEHLFKSAESLAWGTDLVPYWHYPQGNAKIRRLIPSLAFSEEARRYPNMQKILSLYRLAFGQPGQSELLEHLKSLDLDSDALAYLKRQLMIRLAPVLYRPELSELS
ncbi:helicase-related protein [Ectopseudomonas composti]|uniref:helicase-related protein n=1 Tax=Ectopseudomonas composti TaxID=658457 RepID=UPI0007748246|nr:helicase-related protein [Pseudomonas composti]